MSNVTAAFANQQKIGGIAYHLLHADNLQDPDLYVVNARAPDALTTLARLTPGPLRPALLAAAPGDLLQAEDSLSAMPPAIPDGAYPVISLPLEESALLEALAELAQSRKTALASLHAAGAVTVPERRRRLRAGQGPDRQDYSRLRRSTSEGGVLVVDKDNQLVNCVSRLLRDRGIEVNRANDERTAAILCKQLNISLVLINTSTPGVEPYRLCEAIKADTKRRITVVFLLGRYFFYTQARAKQALCDGFVNKPLSQRHLASLLDKFIPVKAPSPPEQPEQQGQ